MALGTRAESFNPSSLMSPTLPVSNASWMLKSIRKTNNEAARSFTPRTPARLIFADMTTSCGMCDWKMLFRSCPLQVSSHLRFHFAGGRGAGLLTCPHDRSCVREQIASLSIVPFVPWWGFGIFLSFSVFVSFQASDESG